MMNPLIGALQGGSGINILQNSANLLQNTVQSWDQLWTDVFTPTAQLWGALNDFGLALAGLGIIYLSIKELGPILEEASWSRLASLFIWPLVIVAFLGGGGRLGAGAVMIVRSIGYAQISSMMQQQVSGQTFQASLQSIRSQSAGSAALLQIYGACNGLPPADHQECINDPVKAQQAQQILSQLGITSGSVNPANIITDPIGAITGILMVILYGVQWAFVNCAEAALIMTALLFPLATALSILPLGTKPLYAWLVAMIAIFSVQLSYNIVVGLVATVSLNAAGPTGFMQSGQDVAFALFLSIFSPILSVLIGSGGGIALFFQAQKALKQASTTIPSVVGNAVRGGIRGVGYGKAMGRSIATTAGTTAVAQNNTPTPITPRLPPQSRA